ncbi:MAG TPA: hypothetical protein VKF39_04455, partial [Nitrososphaerales archaeon]|nr:hypothetical protein [Nitrososphaerales archaeon]
PLLKVKFISVAGTPLMTCVPTLRYDIVDTSEWLVPVEESWTVIAENMRKMAVLFVGRYTEPEVEVALEAMLVSAVVVPAICELVAEVGGK